MQEQVAELARENRSSIEIKRNAKSEYAWDVKVFFDESAYNAADIAAEIVRHIDATLRITYLTPDQWAQPLTKNAEAQS